MLKVTEAQVEDLEKMYPGIREQILRFENATLPVCTRCGSHDTAEFSVGLIGRSINIAGSTTRIRLIANGPKPAAFFCNRCHNCYDGPEDNLAAGSTT
jgi:hypothetical protein